VSSPPSNRMKGSASGARREVAALRPVAVLGCQSGRAHAVFASFTASSGAQSHVDVDGDGRRLHANWARLKTTRSCVIVSALA
jgi:hypothetical protein